MPVTSGIKLASAEPPFGSITPQSRLELVVLLEIAPLPLPEPVQFPAKADSKSLLAAVPELFVLSESELVPTAKLLLDPELHPDAALFSVTVNDPGTTSPDAMAVDN